MLSSSECMELVDRFKKSCEKNDLSESPYNLIVFLEYEELLKDQQLMKAEREGRVVVLPCKVGDTVYSIHTLLSSGKKVIAEVRVDLFFIVLSVCEGRFGKTVFLTRAEAEEALKGGTA